MEYEKEIEIITQKSKMGRVRDMDTLKHLPERYEQSGNLAEFMEEASEWMLGYIRHRLTEDLDIIGDFYLRIYEEMPKILGNYKSRKGAPFTGYLAVCIRHQFMNFIRPRKNFAVQEFSTDYIFKEEAEKKQPTNMHFAQKYFRDNKRTHEDWWCRIEDLEDTLRVPLKLLYAMNLNRQDLRFIVNRGNSPHEAARFLDSYEQRREEYWDTAERTRKRTAHLTYLIQSEPERPDLDSGREDWRRWKSRLESTLIRKNSIIAPDEIADILLLNKSTVYRRVSKALQELRRKGA